MRVFATLPLAALLLAGCSMYDQGYGYQDDYGPPPQDEQGPPPEDAYDDGDGSYTALGTEPFWSLRIDDREMRFDPADGAVVAVAVPRPTRTFNGERYVTRRLSATIANVECSDGMSDRSYADTVTVQVDGRTLRGCGGAVLSGAENTAPDDEDGGYADRLNGDWRVVSINGRAARGSSVSFDNGRLTGRSCNRFSANYDTRGDGMSVGAVTSTRMACEDARMDEESDLFAALEGDLSVRDTGGARIELVGRDGARIVLAPQ